MTGRTHMAMGAAAALATAPLAQMLTGATYMGVVPVLQALLGGVVGGMLPDTDVATSAASRELRRAWAALAVLVVGVLVVDHELGADVVSAIVAQLSDAHLLEHLSYERIAGVAVLVAVCAVGRASGHRGFSHSVVALVVACEGMRMLCAPLALPFAVGYASHLLVDLMNKRPERLLWPLGRGICLHWCDGGGVVDWVLLVAGIACCAILASQRVGVALPALPTLGTLLPS